MKLQHLFSAIAGLTLVAASATPSFAFMNEGQNVQLNSAGVSGVAQSLRNEFAAGETACSDLLNKVNQAVAEIDTRLDAGVADEASYLDARASLLKLRADLPCLAEQLTQMQQEMMMSEQMMSEQMPANAEIISDELVSEETIGGSIIQGGEFDSAGYASGMSSGGYATGGGSFGGGSFGGGGAGGAGGLAGGGGLGGLASLGALGAAIAVGASDDNTPGTVISPSTP